MATPNTYQPRPPSEFVNRLKPINNMHTALMVQSALNIKTKNMGNEISRHGTQEPEKKMRPVVAVQDDSSHWYVIPNALHEEFNELLNISIDEGPEAEEAETKFIEKFSQYMTNGDLNNVQLYAEI